MDKSTTTTTAPPSNKALSVDVKADVNVDPLYEAALKLQSLAIKVQEAHIAILREEIQNTISWADRNCVRALGRAAQGGTYDPREVARTFSTLSAGLRKSLE